jgi:pSer/pThr/pTyr-binding forkhead associated (FHA) protein
MARIQIEHGTRRAQVALTSTLTIGRDPENRIVIADADVALQHARIRIHEGAFYVENVGDVRTLINDAILNGSPRLLRHGDQLRIGSALITFSQDANEVAATSRSATPVPAPTTAAQDPPLTETARISFSCECGAVLRVRAEYAGRAAQCKRCSRQLVIPSLSKKTVTLKRDPYARPLMPQEAPAVELPTPTVAPTRPAVAPARQKVPLASPDMGMAPPEPVTSQPAASAHVVSAAAANIPAAVRASTTIAMCGVCQCAIEAEDVQTGCPQCRLPYHAECWTENLGCAAYGCSQVNALKQGPDIRIGSNLPPVMSRAARRPVAAAEAESTIPWDFILLSASAIGFLISMVTCGVASLVLGFTAFASMVYNSNHGKSTRATTVIALILSCLGFLIGGVVSLIFLAL